MKISIAQVRAVKGDIPTNIIHHKKWIELAVANHADMIIFPELSLTGYEPHLAKQLAIHPDDDRLDEFQKISDTAGITTGIGAPTKNGKGISISMIIFQPGKAREAYSKKYVHADEEPFFISGPNLAGVKVGDINTSFAICYELSIPEHSETAYKNGADIYIASSAKTVAGVERSMKTLSEIASKYSMPVLFSNCIGPSDDFVGAGGSAVWDNKGSLLAQLNDADEGILIFDTGTQQVTNIVN